MCTHRDRIFLTLSIFVALSCTRVEADLLPTGHRAVKHELVFEAVELPANMRLVAAPTRGFQGIEPIRPLQPFSFSSKYGTKLYLVPEADKLPNEFDRDSFEKQWQSLEIPVRQTRSVPMYSFVSLVRTRMALESQGENYSLVVLSHAEFDSSGNRLTTSAKYAWLALPLLLGGGVLVFWLRARSRSENQASETH